MVRELRTRGLLWLLWVCLPHTEYRKTVETVADRCRTNVLVAAVLSVYDYTLDRGVRVVIDGARGNKKSH